jgi:hypothetical protein
MSALNAALVVGCRDLLLILVPNGRMLARAHQYENHEIGCEKIGADPQKERSHQLICPTQARHVRGRVEGSHAPHIHTWDTCLTLALLLIDTLSRNVKPFAAARLRIWYLYEGQGSDYPTTFGHDFTKAYLLV